MRLIWVCENVELFRTFCNFLGTKAIDFSIEDQTNKDWSSDQYGAKKLLLWIRDEDQVEAAMQYLKDFLANPSDMQFSQTQTTSNIESPSAAAITSPATNYLEQKLHRSLKSPPEISPTEEGFSQLRLSLFVVCICCMLFLFDQWNQSKEMAPAGTKQQSLVISPIKKELLFDYPHAYELLDKIVTLYGYDALKKPQELSPAGQFLFDQYLKTPVWQGYYPRLVEAFGQPSQQQERKKSPVQENPPFEKIREGQAWRLISPVLLHNDILHLFFNMMWILLLGIQIELRIGAVRYLALMVVVAALSNIAQYLMSGPNFIGFSGVICGMATFIKARQKIAPWEGYHMSSNTFAFICFFIGILAALSLITFILDITKQISFPIGIANTAHLVGAAVGYWMGKMTIFSWKGERK